MSEQLFFNFPFKKSYLSRDFYVSKNNFNAYKLIETWPKWSGKFVNIFGPKGCGKTHLLNIIQNKIRCIYVDAKNLNSNILNEYKLKECLIVDNLNNNIDENLFYSIINMASQDNKYLIVSSLIPLKKLNIKLKDLNSRFSSFIDIGIDLPTDDLLRVILTNTFEELLRIANKSIEILSFSIKSK